MVRENNNQSPGGWFEKTGRRIQQAFSPKLIAITLTVCYLVSLIPLMILSWYNYPSADDYTNGSQCYHIWVSGYSILSVAATALQRTVEEWHGWRGCFTSSFLSAIPPNVFGEEWYKITTWLVLGVLTASMAYVSYIILVNIFGADIWSSLSITILTLFMSIQCVPGRVEIFYWYSGAINYTFMYGISLLFYGSMAALVVNKGMRKKINLVTASILGFLVSGANQMTMLNAAIVLFALILWITCRKKWPEYKVLGIPIGIFYVGFLLSVTAPGNFVRAEAAAGMNPFKAIILSFYYCFDLVIDKWTTWPVVVTAIVMVPIFWHIFRTTRFTFPYPLLAVFFGYCLVSAMITPPLYAVGNIEAGRLQGEIFLMFVLVIVLCVGYVTGWARKKYECMKNVCAISGKITDGRYGMESCLCLVGGLFFLMFGTLLTVIPNPRYFTTTAAVCDYMDGSARAYGEALRERAALYLNNQGERIGVEPLREQPELLFFSDITDDEEDWKNRGVARFYDLEAVALISESTESIEE